MLSNTTDKLLLNVDGGSRGNPGPSAYAFVATINGTPTYNHSAYLGIATNNVAEYTGLIEALKYCTSQSQTHIEIQMDSQLVVNQINGTYKVKQPHLIILHQKATSLINEIKSHNKSIVLTHTYRNNNHTADRLLNETLDLHAKT